MVIGQDVSIGLDDHTGPERLLDLRSAARVAWHTIPKEIPEKRIVHEGKLLGRTHSAG